MALTKLILPIVALSYFGYAVPVVDPEDIFDSLIVRDEGEDQDSEDLSYIKSWAALGDSYAAGIGSGKRMGSLAINRDDWLCSRWDMAYPSLMNQAEQFGEGERDFKFLACSGWTSTQVKDDQVPKLSDKSQQLITLSAGGNDVYLSDLLDACVYQISPDAALHDRCQEMLDKTSKAIDDDLGGWLEDLYKAIIPKLTDDGKIYQTGYAQFFDANTEQCDSVSWGVYQGTLLTRKVYLSKNNRKQMNDLALRVNDKIKEVIHNNYADRIVFVDIDPYVRLLQGRFCERGIKEPDKNRQGLLFYNRGTSDGDEDEWHHDEFKREPEEMKNATFEGQIASKFEAAMKDHPDWKLTPEDGQGEGIALQDGLRAGIDPKQIVTSALPDTFKRIFHPRPFLHGIMGQLVLYYVSRDRAKALKGSVTPSAVMMPQQPKPEYCNLGPGGGGHDLQCFERSWAVLKEKTSDGSTSVLDAIKQFCKNRHGERATPSNIVYDRWDVSGFGIPKRQSMWIRASPGPHDQCQKGGAVWERNCVDVLTNGLHDCHPDTPYSHGFKVQGRNCLEYMVDISASIHEGDPPWDEHVVKYPPPETVMAYAVPPSTDENAEGKAEIYCSVRKDSKWSWDDANKAIDQYCGSDSPYTGGPGRVEVNNIGIFAGMSWLDWEPKRSSPYQKEEWCNGFDAGHKNSDDCRYAFKKIFSAMESNVYCMSFYRCAGYYVHTYNGKKTVTWLENGGRDPDTGPWPVFIGHS